MHQTRRRARLPSVRRRRPPPFRQRCQHPMHQFPQARHNPRHDRPRPRFAPNRQHNAMPRNAPHQDRATPSRRPIHRRRQKPMHQFPRSRRHPPRRAPERTKRQHPMHQFPPRTTRATRGRRPTWPHSQKSMHQNAPARGAGSAARYRSTGRHAAGCVSRSSCPGTSPRLRGRDARSQHKASPPPSAGQAGAVVGGDGPHQVARRQRGQNRQCDLRPHPRHRGEHSGAGRARPGR